MAYPASTAMQKGEFVIRPERFAIDDSLQFAMRELHGLLAAPRLWAGLAGAALLLGMVGPFGTYEYMSLPARLAYWTAVVVTTYLTGFAAVHFCVRFIHGKQLPGPLGFAFAGAIAGLPVAALVALLNRLAFGEETTFDLLTALPYCVAAGALISGIVTIFARDEAGDRGTDRTESGLPPKPPILDRLPSEKRGKLAYLTMQDHYVEVHTDRGRTLVLMRFGDAITETTGVDGFRIHRSHWIARDAVEKVVRGNGKLLVRMHDGIELPVSRSYSASVRAAGLG